MEQRWRPILAFLQKAHTGQKNDRPDGACFLSGDTSISVHHRILRVDHEWSIQLQHAPDNQYLAGGDHALIDGLTGGDDFRTGEWQGYFGKPCVATIDLGTKQSIQSISINALQDIKPWIWSPQSIQFAISEDGKEFSTVADVPCSLSQEDQTVQIEQFVCNTPCEARFVRVEAQAHDLIPSWHLGHGNPRWMFLDEISIHLAP